MLREPKLAEPRPTELHPGEVEIPGVAPPLVQKADAKPFEHRAEPSALPELMDAPCSYEEFRACLRDLEQVNRFTQAYGPTLGFLERVVSQESTPRGTLRILDVGAGGGDMLRRIARWAREQKVDVDLTGVDLNPHSTRAAREFSQKTRGSRRDAEGIRWVNGDALHYDPPGGVDLILSALFTHHLESPESVRFLAWMERTARVGWFINDLYRSQRAARWFRVLPILFRWHKFVRHDGPVSLQRAFTAADWQRYLADAQISGASVESHAFNRLCVARIRELA